MDNRNHQIASVPQLINAYGEWVEEFIGEGFRVYLVTFKFNNIPGSHKHKSSRMLREIEDQFYPTLIKHVERRPLKPSRQCNLPRLIAIPDRPVAKKTTELSLRDVKINDGLHVHAIVAMAPTLRTLFKALKLRKLLREKRHRFIGDFTSIADIDAVRIKSRARFVTDYVFKSAKRSPALLDNVLILPKAFCDVTPRERAMVNSKAVVDD
jgi:hypothetical protein